MNNIKRKVMVSIIGASLLTGGASISQADTSYDRFNEVVPSFNGSVIADETQRKVVSGQTGIASIYSVGGSRYAVDARMWSANQKGDWSRNLNDDDVARLYNNVPSNQIINLELNSDLSTPVDTQVRGSWKGN